MLGIFHLRLNPRNYQRVKTSCQFSHPHFTDYSRFLPQQKNWHALTHHGLFHKFGCKSWTSKGLCAVQGCLLTVPGSCNLSLQSLIFQVASPAARRENVGENLFLAVATHTTFISLTLLTPLTHHNNVCSIPHCIFSGISASRRFG